MWRYPSTQINYRGVYFRSVLEARWAATFDHLALKWVYESDTASLSSGRYTPDFWLPEPDIRIEIKPSIEFSDTDRYKEFVEQYRRPFLFIAGMPKVGEYYLRYFPVKEHIAGQLIDAQFAQRNCKKLWIATKDIAVCLTFDAIPRMVPVGLTLNASAIDEAMIGANREFEIKAPPRKTVRREKIFPVRTSPIT